MNKTERDQFFTILTTLPTDSVRAVAIRLFGAFEDDPKCFERIAQIIQSESDASHIGRA